MPRISEKWLMAFVNMVFPEGISIGFTGGPEFSTTITPVDSGFEDTNQNWAEERGEWDGSFINRNGVFKDTYASFFRIAAGKANTWLMKDHADFKSNPVSGRTTLGSGDGATVAFQLIKTYTFAGVAGNVTYDRTIKRPKNGTLSVWVNSILQTESVDYTVDYTTGIVTITVAPSTGEVVEAVFEFYVHCRFDIDKLDITVELDDVYTSGNIPIVEVKE